MKYFAFLSPVLLMLLFPTVLSQDVFQFDMNCPPWNGAICDKLENEFINTGKVIASNLVLNTNIVVEVSFEPLVSGTYGGTTPTLMKFVSPDEVERLYPTSLLKQLNTGIPFGDDPDIKISINSDEDVYWFPGDGDIQPNQIDVSELALHEMMHGLGFTSTWEFPPDRFYTTFITPRLNGDPDINFDDPITFDGFYETVYDGFLVYLEDPKNPQDAKRVTDIAQSLNGFTAKGTKFPDVFALFDEFAKSKQQDDAKLMLTYATTASKLAFMPPKSLDPFMIDTTDEEFSPGNTMDHVSQELYDGTADFLMVPFQDEGVTLQTHIKQGGNSPGGGIGPKLRTVLQNLGYTINPNPPPQKRRFTRRNNQRKPLIHF